VTRDPERVPAPGVPAPAVPARPLLPADEFAWHAETVHLLVLSPSGALLQWNGAAARGLGAHAALREGEPVWGLLAGPSASLLRACLQTARTGPARCLLTFTDGEGFAFTLSCSVHPRDDAVYLFGEQRVEDERRMNEELIALTDELALAGRERARLNARLEAALADLKTSHWHIRKFQEFLPVCAVCHRVAMGRRDEPGWESLVHFLARSGLLMSHGYCPRCEADASAELDGLVPGRAEPPPT
jgi:hypothetical protein